jgi:tRNA pseudouridine55 synthase
MSEIPELLLIDKPKGITSFDVIRRLRRQLGVRKMGHAGTLDPLASGLMLIGVGSGTKKLTKLTGLDKEYVAEVRIGERRTTGDLEGEVMEEREVEKGSRAVEVLLRNTSAAITTMLGEIELPVSAYSAIKVDGVPMYKKARQAARRGEVVNEVPIRNMTVKEAELLDFEIGGGRAVATIRFLVSKGTYIRSLAEELGRRLGYPATLQNLRRTKVGEYRVEDAQTI